MSAPRIAGLIVALVMVPLLLWNVVAAFIGWNSLVLPTGGVKYGQHDTLPTGLAAHEALRERTELQRWGTGERAAAAIRAGQSPSAAAGEEIPGSPPARVASWLGRTADDAGLMRERGHVAGLTTLPYPVADVFQQPGGRTWRRLHNSPLTYGGGIYILGMTFLLGAFLAWRGRVPVIEGFSGRTVERFTPVERANHWLTATSFLIMALTGLVVIYGRYLLMPWMGAAAFSTLSTWSAWTHMAFAVPFVIGIIVMAVLWTRQNLFTRLDWNWLKQGGGFTEDKLPHPPARRFNAGQKLMFWGAVLGGLALLITGIPLMFPFFWLGYDGMQWAQFLHALVGLLMIGLIIGHIYIGTIGMQGAIDAMWGGQVDRNWAKEHHSLWYREITERGTAAANRQPAE